MKVPRFESGAPDDPQQPPRDAGSDVAKRVVLGEDSGGDVGAA